MIVEKENKPVKFLKKYWIILVLLVLAVEMIFGVEIFKNDSPCGSATIVPLVFPLIAGAASFTTLLSLRAEYNILNIILNRRGHTGFCDFFIHKTL